MGCYIHWYSETKRDGKWEFDYKESFKIVEEEEYGYSYPDAPLFPVSEHDYTFFGLIADVRGVTPWNIRAKGFPEDASEEMGILFRHWEGDAHTPSYLNVQEFHELDLKLQLAKVEMLINPIKGFAPHHAQYLIDKLEQVLTHLDDEDNPEDRRLVFWFDN